MQQNNYITHTQITWLYVNYVYTWLQTTYSIFVFVIT